MELLNRIILYLEDPLGNLHSRIVIIFTWRFLEDEHGSRATSIEAIIDRNTNQTEHFHEGNPIKRNPV